MQTSEIRSRWLDYFAKQGHHLAPSVPLVSPDKSILFTIAGMVPFIPYIVGTEPAPRPRVASVQKCIRTNDIEEVGKTTRHGTFFQMCGNFSFGDYFKQGASTMAWDLLTGSVDEGKYGLDGDKLWVTIWENDAEAEDIWLNQIGLDPMHLQKLPREEIFWDTGQPGPAGPCAEIHFDRGSGYGPEGGPEADTGGDRYLELWNLVFDQYLRGEGRGKDYPLLGELDKKCIDTGLGLERLAFLLQGKDNMYEIDQVFPVIEKAQELSGKRYTQGKTSNNPDDIRMRVVADHVRSALMLIGDGVRPGNDGRGYVLRRLIRRVVRAMRLLGVEKPVFPDLLPVSKREMAASYPELDRDWETISTVAYAEEEAFRRTLESGTLIFDQAVTRLKQHHESQLSGKDAFALHDTYGFPIDLTIEMAAEHGIQVDREKFTELMQEQKNRAREDARAKKTGHVDARIYHELEAELGHEVEFVGYTEDSCNAKVIGLLADGQAVPAVSTGSNVEIVLDATPFYAEMGGQLADHGVIRSFQGAKFKVEDVQSPVAGLRVHRGTLEAGQLAVGDEVVAAIDTARRQAIARSHTATHMLHKALQETLGAQATQAGSENNENRLRFDFHHGKSLNDKQTEQIFDRINDQLRENLPVNTEIMSLEDAKKSGATALFGEKYGQEVRVVDIGNGWDRELCGGTHMPTTGYLGQVVLMSESSIGSGVRRIEALVADKAADFQAKEHELITQIAKIMGTKPEMIPSRIDDALLRLRHAQKELNRLQQENLLSRVGDLAASAKEIAGKRVVSFNAGQVPGEALRALAEALRQHLHDANAVVAVGGVFKDRPSVVVATTASARDTGLKAGNLVKIAAQTMGGGGGGRPDLAQGGGKDARKLAEALQAIEHEIANS
ncbi:MAG: alanine--tRNA ligase [Varibaculum cambriense]